jgi:hypothetical protein
MAARLRLAVSKGGPIQLRDAAADLRARRAADHDLTYLECVMLMRLLEHFGGAASWLEGEGKGRVMGATVTPIRPDSDRAVGPACRAKAGT